MNKTLKYIGSLLFGAMAIAACSPDDFESPSQLGIPSIESANVQISVDQNTNQVTFLMDNKQCYPVWYIPNGKSVAYSTVNGLQKVFAAAGTYDVEYQIGNANGVSLAKGQTSFTIDNTIFNFDQYYNLMCGGAENSNKSKTWRINKNIAAHMACGESGTDGTNWWSAQPDDKAGTGLYECEITLTTERGYTINPTAGTVYVNTNNTIFPEAPQPADFSTAASEQTVQFDFEVEGDNLYLVLPARTWFPYISEDKQYTEAARYRIESITPKQLVLIYDNGDIAWRFVLTSEATVEDVFTGFKYDSDCNMFRTASKTPSYWYAPGWAQIADPETTVEGSAYTLVLPEATTDKWQCQFHLHTDMATNSATKYDFSCVFNANKDHGNVTVKLTNEADDAFYFDQIVQVKAYEDYVFYVAGMDGLDMEDVKVVFDFGGNAAETTITVKDIVLKENSCDDGTHVPEPSVDNFNGYNAASDCNMWKNTQFNMTYWYAPGWSQIEDPEMKAEGNNYTFTLPIATTDQWQAQVFFNTDMATNSATHYDFSCVLVSNSDHPGVTLKLQKDADNFYFVDKVALKAYEETVYYMSDLEGIDIDNVILCLDFGGNANNAEITIKDIVLKEHDCDDGAGQPGSGPVDDDTVNWDWTSGDNLWKAVYDSQLAPAFWYAPGWNQIADPSFEQNEDEYSVTLPEATTDQWQAQMHFDTNIGALQEDAYNFYCVLVSDQDHPGVTVKLTQNGNDDNFFFADKVALTAYEEKVFKKKNVQLPAGDAPALNLFFDFGGNGANQNIKISKIYLEKVQ